MIVVDASVLAPALGAGTQAKSARQAIRDEAIALPDVAVLETAVVLRKAWLSELLSEDGFQAALRHLKALPAQLYGASPLLPRIYELRANVSPYDAVYVALAEALGCTLVTAEQRLARASGIRCDIRVLESQS